MSGEPVIDTTYGPEAARIILTVQQQAVLAAVDRFTAKNKYPPTIRELMTALGYKTTSGVHYHLVELEALGCLGREYTIARGVWVTAAGKQLLEAHRHA